jgi:hypothetical protein
MHLNLCHRMLVPLTLVIRFWELAMAEELC